MNDLITHSDERKVQKIKSDLSSPEHSYASLKTILKENNWQILTTVLEKFYAMYGKIPFFCNDKEIKDWCVYIVTNHIKLATIRAYLLGMKRILDIGVSYGITKNNTIDRLEDLRMIKIPSAPQIYEAKENDVTKQKIDYMITDNTIPPRIRAIIMFFANSGCRVSELLNLKNSNIKYQPAKTVETMNYDTGLLEYVKQDGYYRIEMYMPKTNSMRVMQFPVSQFRWIRDNINQCTKWRNRRTFAKGENDYFLKNQNGEKMTAAGLRYVLRYYWTKIFNGDHITPHKFRHWLITHKILIENRPIAEVSRMVGHKSINTTMIYTHTKSETGQFDTIKTPEQTSRPKMLIVDNTAQMMAETLGFKRSAKVDDIEEMSENEMAEQFSDWEG